MIRWEKLRTMTLGGAKNSAQKTLRGDTLIEVMFAIAVFALVAVLSIAMMNLGVASSERSLELVTARNELNAQAEALRFIHSSYVSEMNLPECTPEIKNKGEKCQQFKEVWKAIVAHALEPHRPSEPNAANTYTISYPLETCQEVYDNGDASILRKNNAFVLNTRRIGAIGNGEGNANDIYISITDNKTVFQPATLGARLVYKSSNELDKNAPDEGMSTNLDYNKLAFAEGIWVVAVKEKGADILPMSQPKFYDFYIETCWYGPSSKAPISLDAVIRLYNPDALSKGGE